MATSILTMALLMGLTGSLHCAGMCGPIIWVMPFQFMKGWRRWWSIGLYHLGRISVYALLGLLLYSFKGVFDPAVQRYVSVVLGIALLMAGILSFQPNRRLKIQLPWTGWIRTQLGTLMTKMTPGTLLAAGILNGLLPCGLVYMALSAAVLAPDRGTAVMAMYFFGLGTIPMLVGITVLKGRFNTQSLLRTRRFVPVIMLAFGLLFIIRGLNLGVPYLSPKIEVVGQEVKASCCHKK